MKLTVVGSGTGIPSATRGAAGYLLQVGHENMLFDCGPGTLDRLTKGAHDFRQVDRIFLTHHHPDHCADIVAFLFANNWEIERRAHTPLRIFGPATTRTLIEKLYDTFPGLTWQKFAPQIHEWDIGRETADNWIVTSAPVDHVDVPAIGYRVEQAGRVFVYSGDTSETTRIVELARGADTLLIDCSFPDEIQQRAHLTAGGAGRIARAADVNRVVLTHFYPACEKADIRAQCAAEFDGEIVLAEDGLRLEI